MRIVKHDNLAQNIHIMYVEIGLMKYVCLNWMNSANTVSEDKCRWYPQQQGDLGIPFYTANAFTLRTALQAALRQPQDGKNLVPHSFCSAWSRNLRNPIETRNLRNLRNRQNPGTPKPSKPQPLSESQNPSKPGTSENLQNHGKFPNLGNAISGTWNLRKTSPIERNRSGTGSGRPVPSRSSTSSPRRHRNLYCARPHSIQPSGKNNT